MLFGLFGLCCLVVDAVIIVLVVTGFGLWLVGFVVFVVVFCCLVYCFACVICFLIVGFVLDYYVELSCVDYFGCCFIVICDLVFDLLGFVY